MCVGLRLHVASHVSLIIQTLLFVVNLYEHLRTVVHLRTDVFTYNLCVSKLSITSCNNFHVRVAMIVAVNLLLAILHCYLLCDLLCIALYEATCSTLLVVKAVLYYHWVSTQFVHFL